MDAQLPISDRAIRLLTRREATGGYGGLQGATGGYAAPPISDRAKHLLVLKKRYTGHSQHTAV